MLKVGVRRLRSWKAPLQAKQIKPEGWDIADAIPPGMAPEVVVKSILEAPEIAAPGSTIICLDDWLKRDLPKPDYILGHWLTTTSRVLFPAPTGIGKSMFWVALGMAMAAGLPFLRWEARRPCKVLYIDGEMSRRLMKERLIDETTRLGMIPAGFHVLNHEDVENFAPLNSAEGRNTIEATITRIGGVDFIIFDNIMSLISGDMKEEEGWRQTVPWQHSLTKRNIGQAWLHHTNDDLKTYGTKTREWQMDTVVFGEKVERPDIDVSFKLVFRKARERTPQTRAGFADLNVALVDNDWTYSGEESPNTKTRPSPLGAKFLAALVNVLAGEEVTVREGRRCATMDSWQRECGTLGLIDRGAKPDSARSLLSKYRRELVARDHIACNEQLVWKI
jgi:hypothetical protein